MTIIIFICFFFMLWPVSGAEPQLAELAHALGWWLFWPGLGLALWSALAYLRPQSTPRQQ